MSTTEVDAGGRPPHEPDAKSRAQVETMAGMGLSVLEIGAILQISEPTVRKHYALELATGTAKATLKVAESIYKQATRDTNPNVTAGIFWLKARAGWNDGSRKSGDEDDTPGKKALAQEAAKTAHVGTDWEDLLAASRPPAAH